MTQINQNQKRKFLILVKKLDYNAKITEMENKIPSISDLALTAVENKIPDVSSLGKKKKPDYNTKISRIEKKSY